MKEEIREVVVGILSIFIIFEIVYQLNWSISCDEIPSKMCGVFEEPASQNPHFYFLAFALFIGFMVRAVRAHGASKN